jgi:ferredoxin--NADP+ reductase
VYCPTVTREPFARRVRIPELIKSGQLWTDLGVPALDPAHDRCMICGSPAMLADTRAVLEARGFREGNTAVPGTYVIERAFVER